MNSPQAMICLSASSRISFLFYGLSIVYLTFATLSASYGGNDTDYHALLSFKSMITQDPYKVLTSWNDSLHFCDWSGISCGKRHKRVTALQLNSQGLKGSLSPHVGNLSFLRQLSVKNNSFQGTIPHELGRLSRLRHLYLHENKFSGVIPTNLSGCSNLQEVWLAGNKLAGSIPKEMSLLLKLASLVIQDNKLTGGIPPFLGNITSMERFSAAGNPFGGSIPDTLGLWRSLTEFHSGDCNLYGSIPHSIFNLSLLVNFSVADNHLTGSLPSEIGVMLPNLKLLQLWGNKLTGILPPSLSNCSKLGYLEITDNNFSGKLTIDFSKLRDIYVIRLENNNFHGRGEADDMRFIDLLKNCTRLADLNLAKCNLTGVLPLSIGNLSDQLQSLFLVENHLFGSLPSSIGSLVGLTTLDLGRNQFKGNIPTTIGELQKLQALGLYSNKFSGAIPDAIGNLSMLTQLYLDYNKLEGRIPSSLGNSIIRLTSTIVSASYSSNETDYHALLSFKSKITQDPYQVLTSWNLSYHFCEWSGISCGKRHKRVTALRLDSHGFEGSLSPYVGNLSFLRELSLSNNSFQGTIPHKIGRLSRLRLLYLHANKFSGVIPTNLSGCSNLEEVWLAGNKLAGSIPKEMSLLWKLASFVIEDNNLTGGIPPFLGNITSMEMFSAKGNPLGGSIPDTLGRWKSLTRFYCGGCNLYGSIPHSIFNLSLLVNFSLPDNHLTGSLPTEMGNQLPNLEFLQLRDNEINGVLPPSISNCHIPLSLGKCKELNRLELAENRLGGNIPKQLLQLPSLTITLNLSHNHLSGSVPSEIKDLKGLSGLDLSYNNLSGNITSSLGECSSLTLLILGGNMFQGVIPSSFSSLGGLEVLDISQNNLSGKIPQFLDKWESLEYLNLSFNDFEGEVPAAGVFANTSAYSVLGNNRLCGGLVTLQLPKCKKTGSKKKWFPFFVLVIVIAPTLLIVLCCAYLLCKKKRNSQPSRSSGSERFMKVSYNQLLKATDGFSAANLIGEGEFSSVYKGILDSDDAKSVAIKVLHLQYRGAHRSFLAECEAWRNIRHRNLLKIITSCSSVDFQGNDFKALVYEFMPSGSVHDWLHTSANTSKLNLLQRINILKDVATALDYLHNRCQTTIVHGDIKPSNILLDDDMVAHVGDFGLARLLGTDLNPNSSTGIKGTIGYAPPEYGLGSEMTSSGDVYSFGILLLEVMTGKRPTDDMFKDGLSLHKFAYMAFPNHSDLQYLVLKSDALRTGQCPEIPDGESGETKEKQDDAWMISPAQSDPFTTQNIPIWTVRASRSTSAAEEVICFSDLWIISTQKSRAARVPSEIKDLKGLSGLDLSYNNLSGNITSSLVLHLQQRGAHKKVFLAECKAWQNIRHRNLLKIITSCSSVDFQGNDFKALLYEFMPKGSVHDWLHSRSNTSKLNLLQRINILNDVATALDYLHNRCQTTVVHGDLKPSNILLDDDMVAHVGDFGLARLLGTDLNQNSSTGVKGTIGYAPPEYGLGSEMTSSGDVYSFGILLLEVMTGKKPTDDMFNDDLRLHKFAYMALPDHVMDVIDDDAIVLQSTEANAKKVEECLVATIKIGVSCSVDSPPERMKIEIVVNVLQRLIPSFLGEIRNRSRLYSLVRKPRQKSDDVDGKFFVPERDHLTLLNIYKEWEGNKYCGDWCSTHYLQVKALRKAQEVSSQLLDILKKLMTAHILWVELGRHQKSDMLSILP
ncbi:kinase-like domain-containing protein [Tanacetum coccineum]